MKAAVGYELLDSGDLEKIERFGPYVLQRPCPQAIWKRTKQLPVDAFFSREEGKGWHFPSKIPKSWEIEIDQVRLKLSLTDFGHVGVFPEHASQWKWLEEKSKKNDQVLNLFAYSGALSLFLAKKKVKVCHVDASQGIIDWAKENAKLNGIDTIRWIAEDAVKFLKRELRRESRYEGIVLDPPTFGRGTKGELFQIEKEIYPLLEMCKELKPRWILFTCHTPGFTPTVLSNLLRQIFQEPFQMKIEELFLESSGALPIPSGTVAKIWI